MPAPLISARRDRGVVAMLVASAAAAPAGKLSVRAGAHTRINNMASNFVVWPPQRGTR
jgi:hypothetical protein